MKNKTFSWYQVPLWKKAVLASACVSTTLVLIAYFAYASRLNEPDYSGMSSRGVQFSPLTADELEAIYHDAWQAVADNFVDSTKLAQWQEWEHKFDGRLRNERQVVDAIKEMLASLSEKHTSYVRARDYRRFLTETSGKLIGIGVGINPDKTITMVMPDGPAAKAGVHTGDIIAAVDGTLVGGLELDQMIGLIKGNTGDENTRVVISVVRDRKVLHLPIRRAVVSHADAVHTNTTGPDAGFGIRIANLRNERVVEQLLAAVQTAANDSAPGVILDLRNLQGGPAEAAAQIAAAFMSDGVVTISESRRSGQSVRTTYAISNGVLTATALRQDGSQEITAYDSPVNVFAGPVVVLIDENTSGAAEIITAALRSRDNVSVCGIESTGKGTGQVAVFVTEKHVLRITTSRYFAPDGTPIDGSGITPDVDTSNGGEETIWYEGVTELQRLIDEQTDN